MRLSIRSLLTLCYAIMVGFIVLSLVLGVYFSASWSLRQATNNELRSGIDGITVFLRHKYATHDIKHLSEELKERHAGYSTVL
jgi:hypothetical protein